MCLNCPCPEAIPPPNETIKKCRKMLQILAVGILVIGILGVACGDIFQFFYDLFLIYILFMAWTTFNWCMTLVFFIFCTSRTLFSLITFVGLVEYGDMFSSKNALFSTYTILSLAYYPVAVYFSHFCYRNFKNFFVGNNQILPQNGPGGAGNPERVVPNYQRFTEQKEEETKPPSKKEQKEGNHVFQGQGVKIG